MPTATGRMTADEKREADRIRSRNARLQLTARLTTPDWIAAEADRFEAGLRAHRLGQADGSIKAYEAFTQEYEAGDEYVVDRVKIDAGKARAYGVGDELERRGIDVWTMLSFGLFAGRSTVRHILEAR